MDFLVLAQAFEKIEATPSRLEITAIFAELLKSAPAEISDKLVYLSQGSIAPAFEGIDLGMGEKFVIEAIASAYGYSRADIEKKFKKEGDLGLVAASLAESKRQMSFAPSTLTVEHVYDAFLRITKQSGTGSQAAKIKMLVELLNSASALEAKYIVRFPTGKLRMGLGDPTILDALSKVVANDKSKRDEIERAYNLCSDLGFVAKNIMSGRDEFLKNMKLAPLKPIRPALAERENSAAAIFDRLGECAVDSKYDGLRMQVHKDRGIVEIYSRKLEKITSMFPDIVLEVKSLPFDSLIFEGEALAYSDEEGKYFSFQQLMQRKRKHGIGEKAGELPLVIRAFDMLYMDGTDLTMLPYSIRREKLEQALSHRLEGKIKPSEMIIARGVDDIERFFAHQTRAGLEGIIAKDQSMPYTAGARKFAWIKLKKSYGDMVDTIDAIIIGFFKGKGDRARLDFGGILAGSYNKETGNIETLARIGSGFSEDEMSDMRGQLEKIIMPKKPENVVSEIVPDKWVAPEIVITVAYDEITESPMHTCARTEKGKGLALRFPRMV
ncbi:MAG TPA: ATP-dependent DNA ligase, partial [Candidatus Micrarchaeota archaeon]|nr:ATP-dependent DNA ligase [Candidatus Micrarchaeota archaeon]